MKQNKTEKIDIRLSKDLLKKINFEVSKEFGSISKADVVRFALEFYFSTSPHNKRNYFPENLED